MRWIAILTTFFFPNGDPTVEPSYSGADRYLVQLAALCRERGYVPRVYQCGNGSWVREYEGFTVTGIPGTAFDFETNPSLNHVFTNLSMTADLRIYFAPFTCWPNVAPRSLSICHGIWWDYPGHDLSNGAENIAKEYFRRMFYGLTAPDKVVAVDTNVRNVVASRMASQVNKIRYVPNFADTQLYHPAEARTWDRPRVLYPRRLTSLRGSNEVLALAREMPEVDFWFVGRGDSPSHEEQMKQILGSYPNITWQWVPFNEMPELYRQTDVVILPGRAAEGTSLSCVEAMASGLPVVATTVGGLPNMVIDGYNGFLAEPQLPYIRDALKRVLDMKDRGAAMGKVGRDMSAAFDVEVWKRKFWSVVDEVMV